MATFVVYLFVLMLWFRSTPGLNADHDIVVVLNQRLGRFVQGFALMFDGDLSEDNFWQQIEYYDEEMT